ncbi:MAG: metallopeptidase family protein [Planctomycetota bacterium]|nr:metallopeptidase family protein [Planctomycetota bacterium]
MILRAAPDPVPEWRVRIEEAIDAGRLDEAVQLARQACREHRRNPQAAALLSEALEKQGDIVGANQAMARACLLAPQDAAYAADHAWLLFDLGRFDEAIQETARALDLDPHEPLAHSVLAWIAEREHDARAAREHDLAAYESDPEGFPLPLEIDEQFCRQTVAETLEELPRIYREMIAQVPIVVQPHPDPWMLRGNEIGASAFGAYIGKSLLDSSVQDSGDIPPTIYIFSRCLARRCRSREEARAELRLTILHELAHYLGFDEDEMERLGLA